MVAGLHCLCPGLLLFSTALNAMPDEILSAKLEQLAFIIHQDGLTRTSGDPRFKLAFDTTFPCVIKIEERRQTAGNDWQKSYRFSLENMQPGNRFVARDRRRAIIYSARVRYATGERRTFDEKQINTFSLELKNPERLQEATQLIDEIIVECRDRNEF